MDRIDILGDSDGRSELFTKELLSETNDVELQDIVKKAAEELDSPIALVSLVLDQVQFFKAHIGLPPVLAAARGTHRDVSFCQFVVRDGKTFEVNDAANDPRIPQHVVKEYNIQSYLGVPIKLNKTVMGSLCVLDTKKRGFSKDEHNNLKRLAKLVNGRLEAITSSRRQTRLGLTEATLLPALAELSHSLKVMENFIHQSYSADTSIRTFLKHSEHLFMDRSKFSRSINLSHQAAKEANKVSKDLLMETELALYECMDYVNALEQIVMNIKSTHLSEIITSAQDLARNATKLIGGFRLPDFKSDPIIHTRSNMAIAVVTNCLLIISAELLKKGSTKGLILEVEEQNELVELFFSAEDLAGSAVKTIADKLKGMINIEHPTIIVDHVDQKIRLKFSTLGEN